MVTNSRPVRCNLNSANMLLALSELHKSYPLRCAGDHINNWLDIIHRYLMSLQIRFGNLDEIGR